MNATLDRIMTKVDATVAKRIRADKRYGNRASDLGHPCERRLVYERTQPEKKLLPSLDLQYIFDEGNLQERAVLRTLDDADIRVIEQQRPLAYPEHEITGHIDGILVDGGDEIPVDIKSCSPYVWNRINTVEDMLRDKQPHVRTYPAQMTLYLLMVGRVEVGADLLKNKLTGRLKPIEIPLDYDYAEQLLQKADRINGHVKAGTLPEPIDEEQVCSGCPFAHICDAGRTFGTPILLQDDPELIEKVNRWQELKTYESEYRKLDEELKERFNQAFDEGNTNLLIGDYHIAGQKHTRKGYVVQPAEYWAKVVKSVAPKPVEAAA